MTRRIATEIKQQAPIPTSMELVLNVRRTAAVVDAWLERILSPADLRIEEFNILRILRGAGEAGHPRAEVERRMVSSADSVTVALHRLKTRALVEGVFELRITPAGRNLLSTVDGAVADAIAGLGAHIPEARMRAAVDVLELLREKTEG